MNEIGAYFWQYGSISILSRLFWTTVGVLPNFKSLLYLERLME